MVPFMPSLEECINTRGGKEFEEGVSRIFKLALYKMLSKNIEFKTYLHGVNDAELHLCSNSGQKHMV